MGERRKRKSMWDMEENSVAQVNGSFVESGQNPREGKEMGRGNRCYQNMSPGFDGIQRHKYKHSPENDRSDSHRDRSRSRSRGRTRSRSPIRDYRNQSHGQSVQRSVPDKSFRTCRDLSTGGCRRGSQCRFLHSDNNSRGHISKDSYSKSDLRDDVSGSCHGEDAQFRNKSRNAVPCREFAKGKECKWGDTCRFSHHFLSNETADKGNPGDNSNTENDNRLGRGLENENISWRKPKFEENKGNEPGNVLLHGSRLQNKDRSSNVEGRNINVATSFRSDVLDEVKGSRHPIPFSGQDLNQNGENVLCGNFSVSDATDGGQNMIGPKPSNGFSGGLNGPEAQLGARLDLHSRMQNHQKAVQMTWVLETKVAPVTNPTVSPIPRFEKEHFSKHADTEASRAPINPMENESVTNEHGNLTELDEGNKVVRLFKNSLIEFVKDILKPTWKEGRLSRDVHKTIVKKVIDKITSTVQDDHIPKTQDKVDHYLSFSKPKIAKLVQAYVERSLKTDS